MKNSKTAESFAGIIIGVFILSIALLWIANVVSFSQQSLYEIRTEMDILGLKQWANKIVELIDSTDLVEWETFYMHKDTTNSYYYILTWSTNETYKHVDARGEWVNDIASFSGVIYEREFILEKRISTEYGNRDYIDFSIKPLINR